MKEHELSSWSEYRKFVDEIRKKHGYFESPINESLTLKSENKLLFRGQPNKPLKTSLERATSNIISLSQYLNLMDRTLPEVESHTGFKWDLPNRKVRKEVNNSDQFPNQFTFQEEFRLPPNYYSYAIYLHQYGYPSPLLDWTASPYIAAYFALCDQPQENDDCVAIYTYIEMLEGVKAVNNPTITVMRPETRTHKRHFAQKAWYTIASKWEENSSDHIFCSHHDIFDDPPKSTDPKQDYLLKVTIPTSERNIALKELDNDLT